MKELKALCHMLLSRGCSQASVLRFFFKVAWVLKQEGGWVRGVIQIDDETILIDLPSKKSISNPNLN